MSVLVTPWLQLLFLLLPPSFLLLFPLQPKGGGGSSLVIDLRSPANANADTDEEDNNAVALSYWTTAWNPLLAMEAIAQEQNGEDNDGGEFLDALVKSAIAHHLKRNTNLRDLSFTPQQLKDLLNSLTENQREVVTGPASFAIAHVPSLLVPPTTLW